MSSHVIADYQRRGLIGGVAMQDAGSDIVVETTDYRGRTHQVRYAVDPGGPDIYEEDTADAATESLGVASFEDHDHPYRGDGERIGAIAREVADEAVTDKGYELEQPAHDTET